MKTFLAVLTCLTVYLILPASVYACSNPPCDANPPAPRLYEIFEGTLNLGALEGKLSEMMGESVAVTSIRWSIDPRRYLQYLYTLGGQAYYVVRFNSKTLGRVSCHMIFFDMVYMTVLDEIHVTNCSKTNISGEEARTLIERPEIGLPAID